MRNGLGLGAVVLLTVGAMAVLPMPATADPGDDHGLGREINRQLRAEGPFFTQAERAVIERACGYAPGEWDGYDLNTHNNVLVCTNGRRVDSPEVRRVLRAAAPRISARVNQVMASPEVRGRIRRITEQATAAALRAVEVRFGERD